MNKNLGEDQSLPWDDVEASRHDEKLQTKHPISEAKQYFAEASPCLECRMPAEKLTWFYFRSPDETWDNLYRTEGWIAVCDKCYTQVNYFPEIIN